MKYLLFAIFAASLNLHAEVAVFPGETGADDGAQTEASADQIARNFSPADCRECALLRARVQQRLGSNTQDLTPTQDQSSSGAR
jgi:hypothetical protein